MGFLDKAKGYAEQATTKAKEVGEDLSTKRELSTSYTELGRVAYALAQRGEISHSELTPLVERVSELEARTVPGSDADGAAEAPASEAQA